MTNWKPYKFSDLVNIIGGGTPKTSVAEYWNGSIPWLSVVDFGGDRKTVYRTEKSITDKGLYESSTKLLKKGQLIISARGTVGEIAVLGADMAFNQSCYGLNGKPELAINNFLYYLLKYKIESLKSVAHGSVFDTITRQTFEQLEVNLPNLPTQHRIAEILSALDDKIELNRRMNQTLEQMAQTFFRQYFVDSIDEKNLPQGWQQCTLEDVIDIKHGYAFKGEFFSDDPTVNILVTPGNFRIGGGFNTKKYKYYKGAIPEDYILAKDDLIVTMTDLSKDGDTLGYSALVPTIPNKLLLHNQRIGKVIYKSDLPLKFYLYWLMRSDSYRTTVLGSASGSTVKHTSPSRILEYKCIIPNAEALMNFEDQVKELYAKEHANQLEIYTLSTLRDTLLPKLMSGEIDVMQIKPEELHEPVLS